MRYLPWPRRVDAALLCFSANVIANCDRISISAVVPHMMREYGWDTAQTGWILSGFFVGYVAFMTPVGLLVDRVGPKRVFAFCMAWWSLFTALTAFPRSILGLSAVRVALGAGESGIASCLNGTLVRWFPPREYARATGLCWSGGYLGPLFGFPLAAFLLARYPWHWVFYIFGCLGLLWLPFWLNLEEPEAPARAQKLFRWSLLKSPAIWAVFLLHFSSNWFLYVMFSWLPTYLTVERHFSLQGMAAGASAPFLCAWIGANLFAQVIDRLSLRTERLLVQKRILIAYAAAAGLVLATPFIPNATWSVLLLCLAMLLFSAATPIFSSASLILAPEYAGLVAALQNCFANFAGILAPVSVGYMVKLWGWDSAFWLTAAVMTGGLAAYLIWGANKVQPTGST